ncbi:MAG: RsmB/NOP family class I SAM-dependent RNA methyltransferase [Clostridia bacterium]|nr:RsmB/NOP family class I SAM-dependent RNA methyltransferase [Clostridia bacterium]
MEQNQKLPKNVENRLVAAYGENLVGTILAGYEKRRPVTLRVNRLKSDREEVVESLEREGMTTLSVPWSEDAMVIPDVRENMLEETALYKEGKIYLQSLSAMLPVMILKPEKGESILDMCAAPGGKTTQIAAMTENRAGITACERDRIRCERLKSNLARQSARATVMQTDARQMDELFRFGKILLDAPCTGSGTLQLEEAGRPPRMEETWIRKTISTQKALIRKAWKLLSPGGVLVYSTCSILPEENEGVVQEILRDKSAALRMIPEDTFPDVPKLPVTIPGTLCVCPSDLYEGFFVSCIEKRT